MCVMNSLGNVVNPQGLKQLHFNKMAPATRRPVFQLTFLTLFSIPTLAASFQKTCPHSPLPPSFLSYPHQLTSPVPIDNGSPPNLLSRTPWTSPPYCVIPSSIGSTERLCLYTASSYNGNAGISIIAPPDTAATLVDAIQNSTSTYAARRHIYRHQEAPDETLPYKVATIPGKGKGVIATKHIAQFDIIMTSFPAMVADNDLFPADEDEGPVEGPRLFKRALEQLTDQGRFLDLATSRDGQLHIVEDVIRTNAFGIYTVDGRDFKGLYPEIAVFLSPPIHTSLIKTLTPSKRLNHACNPKYLLPTQPHPSKQSSLTPHAHPPKRIRPIHKRQPSNVSRSNPRHPARRRNYHKL